MSTLVEIRYPLGRVHANPWHRHPNEGTVEWPPSPWRLLRALYAVWRGRVWDLDEGDVRRTLGRLGEQLPVYWLPPSSPAHTRHWMPKATHRSDPGGYDKSLVLDGFVAVAPERPLVVEWPFDIEPRERDVMDRLLAKLTYLGRAESVVEARRVATADLDGLQRCAPLIETADDLTAAPAQLLACAAPFDPDVLAVTTGTTARRRLDRPPGTRSVAYQAPLARTSRASPAPPRSSGRVEAVLWRVSAPALPSARAAVAQGDALRSALLRRYGRGFDGRHSEALSGHDAERVPLRAGHAHAHFLHFDLDGDGLLEVALLWAPGGFDADEVEVATALRQVRPMEREGAADVRPVSLGLEYAGPAASLPTQIVGPRRRWTSLTPFAPTRHAKRGDRHDWPGFVEREVRRSIDQCGLPEPESVGLLPAQAWLQHRRHRLKERLRHARHAVGVEVVFDQPVAGPVALGGLSHFGLGVMLPVAEGPGK